MCKASKKYIFIHSALNTEQYDTLISHKKSSENVDSYQNSFNIFSIKTIRRIIESNGFKLIKIERFNMKQNLKKPESSESILSYHSLLDNEKVLTNQLGIIMKDFVIFAEINNN